MESQRRDAPSVFEYGLVRLLKANPISARGPDGSPVGGYEASAEAISLFDPQRRDDLRPAYLRFIPLSTFHLRVTQRMIADEAPGARQKASIAGLDRVYLLAGCPGDTAISAYALAQCRVNLISADTIVGALNKAPDLKASYQTLFDVLYDNLRTAGR